MTAEWHIRLPLEALEELACGGEVVFDLDKDVRVIICCDAQAIEEIQERIERSLLHRLPIGDSQH